MKIAWSKAAMDAETTRANFVELFGRVTELEKAHVAMAQTDLLLTGMVNKHDGTLYGDGQDWLGLVANQKMLVDMHKEAKADRWQKIGFAVAIGGAIAAPLVERLLK